MATRVKLAKESKLDRRGIGAYRPARLPDSAREASGTLVGRPDWQQIRASLDLPRRAPGPALLGWAVVSAAILLLWWLTGPVPSSLFASDTLRLVNIGYRVQLGQVAGVDFLASYYGPVFAWLMGMGVRIAGETTPVALHVVQGLCAIALGSLLFLVCLPRLRLPWALLLLLGAQALLILATPLGYAVWREFGYAMYYNPICYVLVATLFASVLLPHASPSPRSRTLDALVQGLVLALLFLTKASFAAPSLLGFAAIQIGWPLHGGSRRWGVAALALFGVATVALAAPLGGLGAYIAVLRLVKSDVNPVMLLFRYAQFTNTLAMLAVAMLAAVAVGRRGGMPSRRLLHVALAGAVVIGVLMTCTASTCGSLDVMPFAGLVPLALVLFVARGTADRAQDRLGLGIALLMSTWLLATPVKDNLLSRVFLRASFKVLTKHEAAVGQADIPDLHYYAEAPFQREIASGIELLRKARPPMTDTLWLSRAGCPFEHMVGMRPPRGGIAWHLDHLIASPADHPFLVTPFLTGVDWILRSKAADMDWRIVMAQPGEQAYLTSHFAQVDDNAQWALYRRTAGHAAPMPGELH